jgi:hypothetical protein
VLVIKIGVRFNMRRKVHSRDVARRCTICDNVTVRSARRRTAKNEFGSDTVRAAASASMVGMVDRFSFDAASVGGPTAFGTGSCWLSVWTFDQLECGNVCAFQPRL